MKVKLIDANDKDFPNLALMKISAYHKDKDDEVGFYKENPDIIYISIIFDSNKRYVDWVKSCYPNTEIRIGGSGVNLDKKLPQEVEFRKPDYNLYDIDYSLGFSTRGCIRNCGFCIVREKEGYIRRWQHPKNFHDDRFDKIRLLDGNILGDKDWFFKITDWVIDNNLKIDFNQGLDIRLLDDDVAKRLSELKLWRDGVSFAWDFMEIEDDVMKGLDLLEKYGIDITHKTSFFILTNYNTTHEEDLYRCKKLRERGTNAYVMRYNMNGDYFTNRLARWANNRRFYWSFPFEEYDRLNEDILEEIKQFDIEV